MTRVRIGGAGGRRNVRPYRVQLQTVQFSEAHLKTEQFAVCRCALKVVIVVKTMN